MYNTDKETRVEISDFNNLTLSVSNCPLIETVPVESIVNDTICCVNGNIKCSNLYKYIVGINGAHIQCSIMSNNDSILAPI